MADRKKTPTRKTPVRRKKAAPKKRRWLLPKFLLILGCVVLLGFLGIVMFLDKEARRMGIFQPWARQDAAPATPLTPLEGDYTPDEKRQLEAILDPENR